MGAAILWFCAGLASCSLVTWVAAAVFDVRRAQNRASIASRECTALREELVNVDAQLAECRAATDRRRELALAGEAMPLEQAAAYVLVHLARQAGDPRLAKAAAEMRRHFAELGIAVEATHEGLTAAIRRGEVMDRHAARLWLTRHGVPVSETPRWLADYHDAHGSPWGGGRP